MSELQPHEKALGQHIIAHCLEGENVEIFLPDQVEYEYHGWNIESVDGDESVIEVHGTQEGSEAELVSRAKYNPPGQAHPAEYKHHKGTIHAIARVDWSEYPLAGESHIMIEFEGGMPRPDPDVHAHMYDI